MNLVPLLEPNWMSAIGPELILSLVGMLLILVEAFAPRARGSFAPIALLALLAAIWAEGNGPAGIFFGGTYEVSPITQLFDFAFILAGLLVVMFSREYLRREGLENGEFYALLLWGTVGMMMMAKGLDLLIVILGLETLSICIFALVGYHRRISLSNEASLKYFLMGAFATGFVLYGTALIYGHTGSTSVVALREYMVATQEFSPMLTIAFVMFLSGMGFKLALAPFHAWAPDVYQGSPTPVAAWLSVAPKAATMIALIRVLSAVLPASGKMVWVALLGILAVMSMVLGNFVATAQRDLKRMLAYSGIAHVGYMTIALISLKEDAVAAIAVYAITYALMNVGAFGIVSLLAKSQNDPQTLNDIAGLGFRRPFLGLALSIFMFSLAGIPPTAGFISKFYIFKVALEAGNTTVAIIGIFTSIVSVYYYLRVVYYLYMKEGDETVPATPAGVFATSALAISIIGILVIGILPSPLFDAAKGAAMVLFAHR
jgi:NADH-quinone oxidoreductase subunit N